VNELPRSRHPFIPADAGNQPLPQLKKALLKDNFLLDEDIQRLMQTLSIIRSEFRYENVELDTMRAVSVSFVRAECVKLAADLRGRVADDGTLEGWNDDAKSEPPQPALTRRSRRNRAATAFS
jgi:hypothetical protein